MIKKFYLFENSLYSDLSNANDYDELEKFVGLPPDKYELSIVNNGRFDLSVKEDFIEDFLNLEERIIAWTLNVTCSSCNYDFYVDDSELDWISRYLTEENLHKLQEVAKFLDVGDIVDNERVCDMFTILGDDLIDYNNIIYEISAAKEQVVRQDVKTALNKLPIEFENSYAGKWDIDVVFDIEKIGEYIEKNNLKDINTVSDFLEDIDFSDINFELENTNESNNEEDHTDTNEQFEKTIDELIEKLNIPKEKYNDPDQLKLFNDDFNDTKYKFDFDVFGKIPISSNNIHKAKHLGGKLSAWFKSYVFQKNYMKGADLKKYEFLETLDIMNPKIEDEYGYLVSAQQFNI